MSSETRNIVLAVILSAVVLFGWNFVAQRYAPLTPPRTEAPNAAPGAASGASGAAAPDLAVPEASAPGMTIPGDVPDASHAGTTAAAAQTIAQLVAASPRLAIDTPRLKGSINLVGARIDDLQLKDYRETIAKDSPLVRLFAPSGAKEAEFAGFGWVGAGAPPANARWTASAPVLQPGKPVTLGWTSPAGLHFEQILTVDDDYLFTVEQRVRNAGAAAASFRPYGFVNQTGTGEGGGRYNLHVGPIGVLDGTLLEKDVGYDKLRDKGPQSFSSTGGWLGITQKYWLAALIPGQQEKIEARYTAAPGDRYQVDWLAPEITIAPGAALSTTSHLYAGAKEVHLLDKVRDQLGADLFDRALAWGWFWFLAQPIFALLAWLYSFFGNYALAIVGLTLIVRAVLYPLANRQYANMAKMRLFAPRMKELQAKYKDDKPKQQQELMALYKKEKINPLAGCLPVLLQVPIFYALYKTLLITVEMRQKPGFLWVHDLSAPDPLTPVNLFGLIPWDPPGFLHLGVLPIILGLTMWLQFRLNPQPMEEIQKKMFAIMPWIFMFMMSPFQTGLQIYWIVNNLVSLLQQWVLLRKYPLPAPAPASSESS